MTGPACLGGGAGQVDLRAAATMTARLLLTKEQLHYCIASIAGTSGRCKYESKRGCGSFFCRSLFDPGPTGRRTTEKRLAPGVARTATGGRLLFKKLTHRSVGS